MGRNQGRTLWNVILEINFQTGECWLQCEMSLSEKEKETWRSSSTDITKTLEWKAEGQEGEGGNGLHSEWWSRQGGFGPDLRHCCGMFRACLAVEYSGKRSCLTLANLLWIHSCLMLRWPFFISASEVDFCSPSPPKLGSWYSHSILF
jgi:hypothetical protein